MSSLKEILISVTEELLIVSITVLALTLHLVALAHENLVSGRPLRASA